MDLILSTIVWHDKSKLKWDFIWLVKTQGKLKLLKISFLQSNALAVTNDWQLRQFACRTTTENQVICIHRKIFCKFRGKSKRIMVIEQKILSQFLLIAPGPILVGKCFISRIRDYLYSWLDWCLIIAINCYFSYNRSSQSIELETFSYSKSVVSTIDFIGVTHAYMYVISWTIISCE